MNLIIWEVHGFSHQYPIACENATKPILWGKLGNWYSYFSHSMGTFFPSNYHPMVYLIIWEMHGLPRQFSIDWGNATKPNAWGKSGKLVFILFLSYGFFFPISFPSYGILHHMWNAWVSQTISHSMGKCNKTHPVERTWEIANHNFSQSMRGFLPSDSHPMLY